ncbi:hypothetical protein Scep_026191 [Stephania cephalantha]|uniref:Uncharacterized protein n=1 Tax=Stephania cephalantha TaxID=152367 RepID=A0AAP0HRU9_9MAGN
MRHRNKWGGVATNGAARRTTPRQLPVSSGLDVEVELLGTHRIERRRDDEDRSARAEGRKGWPRAKRAGSGLARVFGSETERKRRNDERWQRREGGRDPRERRWRGFEEEQRRWK